MTIKKILFLIFIALALILPVLGLADWKDDWGGMKTTAQDGAGLKYIDIALFAGNIIRAVLSILGIIILIFILYGGYLWLASGGNEQMVKKAKDILTNAAIGLIIILAAFAITTFIVQGIYGSTVGSQINANSCLNPDGSYNNGDICKLNDGQGNCVDGVCEAL